MDLKSFAETYWSMQEGKVNPGLQAYLDKKKGKKDDGDEKEEENGKESKGSKPDFLDLDKDGDKKEPMKKAAKEKKMKEESGNYVETYLDELKKTTMGSYIAKASKDLADRRFDQGDSEKRKYDPDEADEKEDKKLDKREQGIARAAKKITKEHHQKDAIGKVIEHEDTPPSCVEEESDNYVKTYLEELSKKTLASYTHKAFKDKKYFEKAKKVVGDSPYVDKKIDQRGKGMDLALKKQARIDAKEETVLEQLAENGRESDAFEAVISYLIDEGFAESWEEAQDIMTTLKPELVEEVYQNQLKKLSK